MKTNKKTNFILSIVAVILAIIAVVLIVVSAKASFVSSRYKPPVVENDEKNPANEEVQDDPKKMWFDELFAVFYPDLVALVVDIQAVRDKNERVRAGTPYRVQLLRLLLERIGNMAR